MNNTEQDQIKKYLPPAIFLLKELAEQDDNQKRTRAMPHTKRVLLLGGIQKLRCDDRSAQTKKLVSGNQPTAVLSHTRMRNGNKNAGLKE